MKENSTSYTPPFIFQPKFALLLALTAVIPYVIYTTLRFSGDKVFNQYYYVVPIIILFVIFVIERIATFRQEPAVIPRLIDAVIIITAMWRVIGDVPYISGHALFLTYALRYSRLAQITVAIVMIEVIYLKIFVWNDWITLLNGIILGCIASLVQRHYKTTKNYRSVPKIFSGRL